MFRPGQLVVCIEDDFTFVFGKPDGLVTPRRGVVYRVRFVDLWPVAKRDRRVEFIRLDEITNPSFPTRLGPVEPVFEASAFEPLDDTRLAVFRKMLTPIDLVPA